MAKQEIVYRNNEGVLVNKVFESFEAASGLISSLDRQNVGYDWYEFRNGEWVDASEVTVLQEAPAFIRCLSKAFLADNRRKGA